MEISINGNQICLNLCKSIVELVGTLQEVPPAHWARLVGVLSSDVVELRRGAALSRV